MTEAPALKPPPVLKAGLRPPPVLKASLRPSPVLKASLRPSPVLKAGLRPALSHFQRYKGYDYSRGASLFITIVTSPRHPYFGRVVNAKMELSPLGEEVLKSLRSMPARVPGIRLFGHVVMPDHIHFDIHLAAGLSDPLKTLGSFIGRFKTWTTKVFHELTNNPGLLWQENYHDRLCSRREMMDAVERYIAYNPLKYEMHHNQPASLAIHEPLESPRLDTQEFWRGLGAIDLLNETREQIALRISRQVTALDEIVARCKKGAERFTFISGFISPGEKAVLDALLAMPEAKIIQVLPSAMPHDYLPPSRFLPAIYEGRALIMARGNSALEFTRAACLDLNAAILPIAQYQGQAIYWQATGPQVLPRP